MRRAVQVGIFLAAGVLAASRATAFGPEGHRLAGDIAAHYLCDEARREVGELLDGRSLARAGQWPDWIRSRAEWEHTRPWHYINVGDAEPIAGADESSPNVLWAIDRFERKLADPSLPPARRAEALRFFTHFVVDVHQPLHVGRAEDRGGNDIAVRAAGRTTNLHRVWDAQALLKGARSGSGDEYGRQLRALIALTVDRVPGLQVSGPLDWARESRALRPRVYATGSRETGGALELDEAYRARALATVSLRLSEAGVRLAGRINAVFCPAPARVSH